MIPRVAVILLLAYVGPTLQAGRCGVQQYQKCLISDPSQFGETLEEVTQKHCENTKTTLEKCAPCALGLAKFRAEAFCDGKKLRDGKDFDKQVEKCHEHHDTKIEEDKATCQAMYPPEQRENPQMDCKLAIRGDCGKILAAMWYESLFTNVMMGFISLSEDTPICDTFLDTLLEKAERYKRYDGEVVELA
ncbi:unnamed protein product, partial [Mesorhabditis spiculigera]